MKEINLDNHPDSKGNWIHYLENLEPQVAIRLLVLQVGIALAVTWSGTDPRLDVVSVEDFPAWLFGFTTWETLDLFTYPHSSELFTSEFWKVLTGLFLPGGLSILLLSILLWLGMGRVLERTYSKTQVLSIYIVGSLATLLTGLAKGYGYCSGGLGMPFAAAGAIWSRILIDKKLNIKSCQAPSPGNWLMLPILFLMIYDLNYYSEEMRLLQPTAEIVSLTPVPIAILFSLLTGALLGGYWGIQNIVGLLDPAVLGQIPEYHRLKKQIRIISIIFPLLLLIYLVFLWWPGGYVNNRLWQSEPIIEGNLDELETTYRNMVDKFPNDHFIAIRLAVAYLRQQQWEKAGDLLLEIQSRSNINYEAYQRRCGQLCDLHFSRPGVPSLRFSGLSSNYAITPVDLLLSQAHIARLRGQNDLLANLRALILEERITHLKEEIRQSEGGEGMLESPVFRSTILNESAYLQAELDGDIHQAILDASQSIALKRTSFNLDTMGWLKIKEGHPGESISFFEEAIIEGKETPLGTTHYHLGVAYDELGKKEEAHFHFTKALRRDIYWWEEIDLFTRWPEAGDTY